MQKKNRKGFTLIELLAVIVILAIIALIAVPVIMNVITKARISAFEDSAYGIVKAGEMYYTNKLLDTEGMTEDQEFTVVNGTFKNTKSEDILDISGSIPSSGKVTVTSEGKVAIAISNGEYCIQKSTSESKVKAVKQESCSDYKRIASPMFTTATGETNIPECIANNSECTTEKIKEGIKVGVKVNDSENYDFYIMSEDIEKNEITLIMNQNIGTSAWLTREDCDIVTGGNLDYEGSASYGGPVSLLSELEKRTSNWTNVLLQTYTLTDDNTTPLYSPKTITDTKARLIKHSEAIGLGCEDFNENTCPTWLYENGGNYWASTSTPYGTNTAYKIKNNGVMTWETVDALLGIRPVIIVSKTTI